MIVCVHHTYRLDSSHESVGDLDEPVWMNLMCFIVLFLSNVCVCVCGSMAAALCSLILNLNTFKTHFWSLSHLLSLSLSHDITSLHYIIIETHLRRNKWFLIWDQGYLDDVCVIYSREKSVSLLQSDVFSSASIDVNALKFISRMTGLNISSNARRLL